MTSPASLHTELTQAELGIWLGHQLARDKSIYNAAEAVLLTGPLDVSALIEAIRSTLHEATSLKVAFRERRGVPSKEARVRGFECPVVDLSNEVDPEGAFELGARLELERPFAIEEGELFRHRLYRLSAERHAWLHVAHHIALDGYGFNLIVRRVAERYSARVSGRDVPPAPYTPSSSVLEEDRAYQGSAAREADRRFWLEELRGAPGIAFREGGGAAGAARRFHQPFPEALSATLRRRSEELRLGWSELVLAAVALEVQRETGARAFSLGLPVMLRLGSKALRTPCMAMNLTALPVRLWSRTTFVGLSRELSAALRRQRPHQRYRYEQLRAEREDPARPLFGPVVNLMPFDAPPKFGSCRAEVKAVSAGPIEDLAYGVTPRQGGFELVVDGRRGAYSVSELAERAARFIASLEAFLREPEAVIDVAPAGARRAVTREVEPIHAVKALREHAKRRPHASALVKGERVVTYGELERAARACAAELSALGAGPEGLVALELPPGIPATIVLLGAHLARAGYVALDRRHPRARRERVLGQVAPRVFVHGAEPPDLELSDSTSCLPVGAERVERWLAADVAFAEPEFEPSDVAYVVFTSGSTGEPKGVVIEAGALAHFTGAALAAYELRASDRVLAFAPLTFDASVEELFVTLSAGATLVFRDQAMLDSMQAFLSACRGWEISVLDLPTAFFHELALALAQNELSLPDALRLVIVGGEAVLKERLREWQSFARGVRLLNTYGPSEATVVVTVAALDEVDPDRGVPIGRPLAGVEARLLDAARAPVTRIGEVGEIYLLGPTLARGYFGRDDLTRERFVVLEDGARAYRTLDLASLGPDGALIYEGRVDDEVKISGHRIAPAEVEAALSRHPLVTASIVVGRSDDAGNKHLVAGVEGDTSQLDAATLRAFLADLLPAVLVPSVFELTERLPRTPHGKLDRAAFRDSLSLSTPTREVAGSPGEQKVIDAWKQVLGVGHVALDDNFFLRGGTSLQVIQLANRLSERGAGITVAQIFRHPTPREQARLLSPSRPESAEGVVALSSVVLPPAWFPPSPARATRGRVLLTGATGFVGLHLLERWLREPGYQVACVVRASDEEAARARLLARASRHEIELDLARIEIICLDLTGASGSLPGLLGSTQPCEMVFHAAAEVSLTRDYASLVAPNVVATREAIGLAALWGSSFHQVSTVATAPPRATGSVPEEFFERHAGLSDGYRLSKWHAETLCEEAGERGLRTAVYRLGRISGSRVRPMVNPADLIWRIARASTRLGAWPRLDVAEPWMPADTTADTLVRLALAGSATSPAGVFHLTQTGSFRLERVREALERLGFAVPATELPDWLTRLRASPDDEDRATLAFFELQQAALAGGSEGDVPELSCARVLELVPGVDVEPIDDALVLAYCKSACGIGLLRRSEPVVRTKRR